jgi:hypothetical protein
MRAGAGTDPEADRQDEPLGVAGTRQPNEGGW